MKDDVQKKAAMKLLKALAKDPEGILADAKMISFTILKDVPEELQEKLEHAKEEDEEEEAPEKDDDKDDRPPWLKKAEEKAEQEEEE